jgi:hypothetical protein
LKRNTHYHQPEQQTSA